MMMMMMMMMMVMMMMMMMMVIIMNHPQKEAALYDRSMNGILLRCLAFPSRALMNNPLSFEVLAYTTLSVNSASKISNMSLL